MRAAGTDIIYCSGLVPEKFAGLARPLGKLTIVRGVVLEGCWRLCLLLCWLLVVAQFYIWLDALSWAGAPANKKQPNECTPYETRQRNHSKWQTSTSIYSIDIKEQKRKSHKKPTFLAYMPPKSPKLDMTKLGFNRSLAPRGSTSLVVDMWATSPSTTPGMADHVVLARPQ